jgi:hypothetical protein
MVFVNRSSYAICVLPSVAETATGVESVDAMTGVTAVGAVAVAGGAGREDFPEVTSEDEPAHDATAYAHAIAVTKTEAFPYVFTMALPLPR